MPQTLILPIPLSLQPDVVELWYFKLNCGRWNSFSLQHPGDKWNYQVEKNLKNIQIKNEEKPIHNCYNNDNWFRGTRLVVLHKI